MTRIPTAAALILLISTSACVGASPASPTPMGGPAMAAYFDCVRDGGVAISAHRAVSAMDQPENSIAAIMATGRAIPGAILELDAVLTKDGHLVLMHDETMDRTTTGQGRVADLTLAHVKAARLKASNGALTDAAPPTLAEALDAAGRVGAIASLDLKPADGGTTVDLARAVIDQVRRSGAQDRVILITYNDADARAVAALAPEMMISAGLDGVEDLEGLNPPQILAWTGTREERPALWSALRQARIEVQFGTLGAEGRRGAPPRRPLRRRRRLVGIPRPVPPGRHRDRHRHPSGGPVGAGRRGGQGRDLPPPALTRRFALDQGVDEPAGAGGGSGVQHAR